MFIDIQRQRKGRGREREGNINRVPPTCTLTGDWTHNLGLCQEEGRSQLGSRPGNRPGSWPGVETIAFWCTKGRSNQLSDSPGPNFPIFNSALPLLIRAQCNRVKQSHQPVLFHRVPCAGFHQPPSCMLPVRFYYMPLYPRPLLPQFPDYIFWVLVLTYWISVSPSIPHLEISSRWVGSQPTWIWHLLKTWCPDQNFSFNPFGETIASPN